MFIIRIPGIAALGLSLFAGIPALAADATAPENADAVKSTEIDRVKVQDTTVRGQPGTAEPAPAAGDTVEHTDITQSEVLPSGFRNEALGIKPQFGVLTLDDSAGGGNTRAVGGITLDMNFLGRTRIEGGKPYFGLSLGALYSHLGNPGSDFLGLNGASGDNGTHLLILPADAKLGYTFSDVARLSVHGGGNVLYNNTAANAANGLTADASSWSVHPNVGLDLELGLGRNIGLLIRPDWTFVSGGSVFTGTLGLDFPIT